MNRRKVGQGGGEGEKKKHNQKQTPHCLKKLCGLHITSCSTNNTDNNVC